MFLFLSISRHTVGCFIPYVMIVSNHTNPSNSLSHCTLYITELLIISLWYSVVHASRCRTCESLPYMRVVKVVSAVRLSAVYLRDETASLCNRFPTFRRNILLYLQESRIPSKWRRFVFFETGTDGPMYTITLLYLVCPGLLRAVGETSYGMQGWFIESYIVFTVCLYIYLFVFEV